jgi:hypothetical protein
MSQSISDRYNPSKQLKVNADGSIDVNFMTNPVQLVFTGGINPTGEYDNDTPYSTGDSVSYNGSSYVAIQSTTGNLPTTVLYWQLLSQGNAMVTETFVGNDCSGADGTKNRTLVVTGTPFIVALEGLILTNNVDYSILSSTITFLKDIWNEQRITCWRLL